jgi:putative DNA primase/helicase
MFIPAFIATVLRRSLGSYFNSAVARLIFAAADSFVGPCCKPFGLRAPGVQFLGGADTGKTVAAIIAGATFGGVPDSSLGFGSAWNGTPNGLEEYAPAHNDTLMVLDETSLLPNDQKGRPLAFGEALMRLMQGQGKKRHGLPVDRWSAPLVSTSNVSVYGLLDPKRRENYAAYTDRLMDIPTRKGRNTGVRTPRHSANVCSTSRRRTSAIPVACSSLA